MIADSRAQGFAAVEGYADVQTEPVDYDFHGPIRLYEKAGLVEVARRDRKVVMRKTL